MVPRERCLLHDNQKNNPATAGLRIPPKEPAEAQKTFKTLGGFRLDLLATEPLVTDPVAMEYDENGRAYVAEMLDYPYTDRTNDKPLTERTTDLPLGRIRLLEDTDGDGRFDRSTVFADGLSWPTGLALWKGGVYVARLLTCGTSRTQTETDTLIYVGRSSRGFPSSTFRR